jgi:hypothetical protein
MIIPSYNAKDSISHQDIAEINVRPYKDHGVSQHHRQAHSQIAASLGAESLANACDAKSRAKYSTWRWRWLRGRALDRVQDNGGACRGGS